MSLKIVCTDGSVRVINVSEDFFRQEEEDIILNTKRLCHDLGPARKVELRNGETLVFEQEDKNAPLIEKEVLTPELALKLRVTKRNRILTVKRHKKRLESPTFTVISKGTGWMSIDDIKKERIKRKKSKKQVA